MTKRRAGFFVVFLALAAYANSVGNGFAYDDDGIITQNPVVVGGDFNDVWGSLGEKLLGPAGFLRAGGLIHTYPAFLPVRPLDGLWVRGDIQPERCFRSRLELAREASDHLPLVADLAVRHRS